MDTTLGIDLASQPKHTALCVIAWSSRRAEVRVLAHGSWNGTPLHDELLSGAIRGVWGLDGGWGDRNHPVKSAIDAPFGWPEPFVQALEAHHRLKPWPQVFESGRACFERRATDLFVRERARKLPLSVSTDRIAYCAMRCAMILSDLAQHVEADQVARDGTGLVVEAYPDAALRCWLPAVWTKAREDSYKGAGEPARARRELLVATLRAELGPAFAITSAQREACARSDDCLDALVCALLARAASRGHTVPAESPEQRRLAQTEGWIHLPRPGSLDQLL